MTIGLRDILQLAASTKRAPPSAPGGPSPLAVREGRQRASALIGQTGLSPLPLATRQSFGVPLTPYLLPRLFAAHRFVQKREDIGRRAGADLPLLAALVQMDPALASWEQALSQLDGAGRHGVLWTLRNMSEETDALTAKVSERIAAGGPGAALLRMRLSRVPKVQGPWEAAASSRRERTRRAKESGARALSEAPSEPKSLIGADRPAGPPQGTAPAPRRATDREETTAGLAGLAGLADFGADVTAEELVQMALEIGALSQEIGVPPMSEDEVKDLVRSIDPVVVVVANLYCLLLPEGPRAGAPDEIEGLYTGELSRQAAVLAEMVDLYQEAGRGLRGARDGQLVIARVAETALGNVLRAVHAIVDQPPRAETELLRGDAGDLLRIEAQEREERTAAADRARKAKADQAEALSSVDRQTRFLRTVLSMRNREAVGREELAEAVAIYEEMDQARPEARRTNKR